MFGIGKQYIKVDKLLTQIAIRYTNAAFTSASLIPDLTVQKESDKYRIYKKDGWFKGAPKKADGAETAEATLFYDEGTYSVYERAIKDLVTDRAVQNADAPVKPLSDTTEFLTEKINLSRELDIFGLAVGTSGLNQSGYRKALSAGTAWIDGTAATILRDISDGIIAVVKQTMQKPNVMFVTTEVIEGLALQAEVRDILKLQSTQMVTQMNPLPSLRGLNTVITDVMYDNSDTPGTEDFTYALGNNVIIAFVKAGHPLNFGYNFTSRGFQVARWRDEDREGEFVKTSKIYAPKITCLGAGYIFTTVKNV